MSIVAMMMSPLPASASVDSVCKAAAGGPERVVVCVIYGTDTPHSTTVTITVGWWCQTWDNGEPYVGCEMKPLTVRETGFVPNPTYTPPTVTPSGDVIVYAGTVGTLYVHGFEYNVDTPPFCFGDPSVC